MKKSQLRQIIKEVISEQLTVARGSNNRNPGAGKHTVDEMVNYMMAEIKNADRKEREPLWKRIKHAISQLNIFGEGCPGPPDCPMPH
tara:strand:- start:652 stop:912 length:261 start_codon:yes stop_codon:yes gene_type:complete